MRVFHCVANKPKLRGVKINPLGDVCQASRGSAATQLRKAKISKDQSGRRVASPRSIVETLSNPDSTRDSRFEGSSRNDRLSSFILNFSYRKPETNAQSSEESFKAFARATVTASCKLFCPETARRLRETSSACCH